MKDLEFYILLDEVLEEACRNARSGMADVGRLNSVCIETTKRKLRAKEKEG